jgi:hypothetical protein
VTVYRLYKISIASLVLALATMVVGVVAFSFFYDINVLGDFLFLKVFLPCMVALALAWFPVVNARLKDNRSQP